MMQIEAAKQQQISLQQQIIETVKKQAIFIEILKQYF